MNNSSIDPTPFLKKDNHFSDSMDRSLVNEFSNKSCLDITIELLKNSLIMLVPVLTILFNEITNILLFCYDDNEKNRNYIYLTHYILVQTYYYFFGFIFFLGAMKHYESFINYDKRELKLKAFFYSYSRVFYFISTLLIILPLCLLSYLVLSYLFSGNLENIFFWEFYKYYLIYLPFIFYFNINFQLNLQLLKNQDSYFYLFISNFLTYLFLLYMNSHLISGKLSLITVSLIMNSCINYLFSFVEIKRNVTYLNNLGIFIKDDLKLIKLENFIIFLKNSFLKGVLFNFRYFGIAVLIYSSFHISSIHLLATSIALIIMTLPHFFSLAVSKYYKSYLENSVYDHSQTTKARYLKYFWIIIIVSSLAFSFLILLLKTVIFRLFFNLYSGFFNSVVMNDNISQINNFYDKIVKFYAIFIFFDSAGNSFQEIIKAFNDHSKNYLSFYKGISLVLLFFPSAFFITYFLNYETFWALWIGLFILLVTYSVILFVIAFKNYRTSTFPVIY